MNGLLFCAAVAASLSVRADLMTTVGDAASDVCAALLCGESDSAAVRKTDVAFFGDSITRLGGYLMYLQLMSDLRTANGPRFLNNGISGDTASKALNRFKWDLMSNKPDRVVVMFGMNDVVRPAYVTRGESLPEGEVGQRLNALKEYKKALYAILDKSAKESLNVTLVTPSPYDQYSPRRDDETNAPFCCNEPGLSDCADIVRRVASQRQTEIVDLHAPMTATLKRFPGRWLCGRDRTHPGDEGSMLMAVLFGEALGVLPERAPVECALAGRDVVEIRMPAFPVSFPDVPEARFVEDAHPFLGKLNRQVLRVVDAAEGSYEVLSGSTVVGRWSGEELRRGVDLGGLRPGDRDRAFAAYSKMLELRQLSSSLRNLAFVRHVGWIEQQGGNEKDLNSALASIDRKILELERTSGKWNDTFLKSARTYRRLRPQETAMRADEDRLRDEMRELAQPRPWQLTVRKVSSSDAGNHWKMFDRRLGMFIHWGVYSVNGLHEQEQYRYGIARVDYGLCKDRFRAERFDPNHFIDVAESAGAEYIVMTAKHHDGFCMWNTATTDFNVMNTPAGRDVIGELAAACHRRGMRFGLYFSNPDWHAPFAHNAKSTHQIPVQPGDVPDQERYVSYVRDQVMELTTRYGALCCWFWDIPSGLDIPEMDEMIRRNQPGILIDDRGWGNKNTCDYSTPERDYKWDVTSGRNIEACDSVGVRSWGYRINEDYHTHGYLTRKIDSYLATGANFLLNVGPMSNGRIPTESVGLMEGVGGWLRRVGESFRSVRTVRGFENSNMNLVVTRRENTLYVHLPAGLDATGLDLDPLNVRPRRAILLNDGRELRTCVELHPWKAPVSTNETLHVWGVPADEYANECMVVRLEFDDLQSGLKALKEE